MLLWGDSAGGSGEGSHLLVDFAVWANNKPRIPATEIMVRIRWPHSSPCSGGRCGTRRLVDHEKALQKRKTKTSEFTSFVGGCNESFIRLLPAIVFSRVISDSAL